MPRWKTKNKKQVYACFLYTPERRIQMDMSEKVAYLEVQQARLDERVSDLEDWRKKTNGHLERIEARLNGIGWGIAATLGGVVVDLILRIAGK